MYLGDATTTAGEKPTVGISLSTWMLAMIAAVYLIPRLYRVHRETRSEKKE